MTSILTPVKDAVLRLRRRSGLGGVTSRQVLVLADDQDSDVDGITMFALALRMVDLGEINLGLVDVVSNNDYAAPFTRAQLEYAGRGNTPMSVYKGSSIGGSTTTLPSVTATRFRPGETRSNYSDVVATWTTFLNSQADGNVIVANGGTCTNLAAVFAAIPALMLAKVSLVVQMGGNFVSSSSSENNILQDIAAANALATSGLNVVWAGYEVGNTIMTQIPLGTDPYQNPAKAGWDFQSDQLFSNKRMSWDLVAAFYAIRGGDGLFAESVPGDVSFAAVTSYTTFTPNPSGTNRYLTKTASDATIEAVFDELIADFISDHDTTAPLLTSAVNAERASGATSTYTVTASETFTPSLISFDVGGYSLVGTTLSMPSLSVGNYNVVLRLTDTKGNYRDVTFVDKVVSAVPAEKPYLIAEYLLDENTGQVVNDNSGRNHPGMLGLSTTTSTNDPTWTAEGPDFTPQQVITVPYDPIFDLTSFMLVAVVKLDSISGTRQIITRSDGVASPNHFQFRQTAGTLQFVNSNGNQVIAASSATLTAGAWALVVAKVDGPALQLRQAGASIGNGTLSSSINSYSPTRLMLGARWTTTVADGIDGKIAYAAIYSQIDDSLIDEAEQRARNAVAAKGISPP